MNSDAKVRGNTFDIGSIVTYQSMSLSPHMVWNHIMLANRTLLGPVRVPAHRDGVAAVECACCLPLLMLILVGLWEVGRHVKCSRSSGMPPVKVRA